MAAVRHSLPWFSNDSTSMNTLDCAEPHSDNNLYWMTISAIRNIYDNLRGYLAAPWRSNLRIISPREEYPWHCKQTKSNVSKYNTEEIKLVFMVVHDCTVQKKVRRWWWWGSFEKPSKFNGLYVNGEISKYFLKELHEVTSYRCVRRKGSFAL